MKMFSLFTRNLFGVAVCVLTVGCSSARVLQTAGSAGSVGGVADVRVDVRPGSLDADSSFEYRANSVSGSIRSALLAELRRQGKAASNGATVEFMVTDFRLRSGASVFWVGLMSGSDYLAGTVTVKKGATVLKTFEASAKGQESAWTAIPSGRVSAGSRADVFSRLLARDIANQL